MTFRDIQPPRQATKIEIGGTLHQVQPLGEGNSRWRHKISRRRLVWLATGGVALATIGLLTCWRLFIWQPAGVNPFTPKVMASVQFPLYYPTQLPSGYRVDTKSVTEPQAGVVVFNMVGPGGKKLYMSEEARPVNFGIGNFYSRLTDLKEVAVSDGAVAMGWINHTEITSRANNKTWILSNTNANIPPDQLIQMMKSLQFSY